MESPASAQAAPPVPAGAGRPVIRCPKCGSHFDPPRAFESDCPKCGIWFHKWGTEPAKAAPPIPFEEEVAPDERDGLAPDKATWWGRAALLAFVAIWGVRLAALDYNENLIGGSFMHAILLPIHEAGHVIFRPFGEFMMILGGSLFQVALPFGIGVAFLWKQRDAFGAAMALWWTGTSFVDLAPYIWDSLDPQIVLLGGHTGADGPHDWMYLLGRLGVIRHAHGWGTAAHHLGVLAMAAGVAWGAWWLAKRRPRASPPAP